jgi:hypothetical protein
MLSDGRSHYWIETAGDGFSADLTATSAACTAAGLAVLGDLTCRAGTWCSEGSGFNRPACSSSLNVCESRRRARRNLDGCQRFSGEKIAAAGDYCNVCLAFLAEARRNRSGAFMRSQVCLKSSAAPLHSKSSMELNTVKYAGHLLRETNVYSEAGENRSSSPPSSHLTQIRSSSSCAK